MPARLVASVVFPVPPFSAMSATIILSLIVVVCHGATRCYNISHSDTTRSLIEQYHIAKMFSIGVGVTADLSDGAAIRRPTDLPVRDSLQDNHVNRRRASWSGGRRNRTPAGLGDRLEELGGGLRSRPSPRKPESVRLCRNRRPGDRRVRAWPLVEYLRESGASPPSQAL